MTRQRIHRKAAPAYLRAAAADHHRDEEELTAELKRLSRPITVPSRRVRIVWDAGWFLLPLATPEVHPC